MKWEDTVMNRDLFIYLFIYLFIEIYLFRDLFITTMSRSMELLLTAG